MRRPTPSCLKTVNVGPENSIRWAGAGARARAAQKGYLATRKRTQHHRRRRGRRTAFFTFSSFTVLSPGIEYSPLLR